MTNRSNIVAFATVTLIVLAAADPALAQFSPGGAAVPFKQGLNTALNWVYIVAVAVAVFSLIAACILLWMRNVPAFLGAVLAIVIGGSILANVGTIVQTLSGLQVSL